MGNKVSILGCGPAGLLAALAVEHAGYEPMIFSRKQKSTMFGAQYLHHEIPGIQHQESRVISYELRGSVEGYRKKVYGDSVSNQQVSSAQFMGDHPGWDIRATYDYLWGRYGNSVIEFNLFGRATMVGRVRQLRDYNIYGISDSRIINTIPRDMLCFNNHKFESQEIWAVGGPNVPDDWCAKQDTIVMNGDPEVAWYRQANIFGQTTVEWPSNRKPPVEGVSKVRKPIKTDCNCFKGMHHLGRYGAWKKGFLTHQAYFYTLSWLSNNA